MGGAPARPAEFNRCVFKRDLRSARRARQRLAQQTVAAKLLEQASAIHKLKKEVASWEQWYYTTWQQGWGHRVLLRSLARA